MTKWTLSERQSAQNRHYRQDRLCISLIHPVIQATRQESAKQLPSQWVGHSCVGDVYFKTLESARQFAAEIGYDGIYL